MTTLWTGFAALAPDDCRRLLTTTAVGRLAATTGALPVVVPVQYVLDGDRLLVQTPGHHEVPDTIDGQVVAFETDHLDLDAGVGWCVSVTGTATVLDDHDLLDPVHRWFSDGRVVAVSTDLVTGHRVVA